MFVLGGDTYNINNVLLVDIKLFQWAAY